MTGKTRICVSFCLFFCLLFIGLSISVNSTSVSLPDNPNQDEKRGEADLDESGGLVAERACYARVTSNNGVNIRQGPSTRTQKLGEFLHGARVEILDIVHQEETDEEPRTWYKTSEGWIPATSTSQNCRDVPKTVEIPSDSDSDDSGNNNNKWPDRVFDIRQHSSS